MRRVIAVVLLVVSIALLSFSIYSLMGMFREYKQADELHDKLQKIHENAEQPKQTDEPVISPFPVEPEETESPKTNEQNPTKPKREVDPGLLALHEENQDCRYWITIPNTEIDYPVMFRPTEKDYYRRFVKLSATVYRKRLQREKAIQGICEACGLLYQ